MVHEFPWQGWRWPYAAGIYLENPSNNDLIQAWNNSLKYAHASVSQGQNMQHKT